MTTSSQRYIGIMSGTSLDGVDVALIDYAPGQITRLASRCFALPAVLRAQLLTICQTQQVTLQQLGEVDNQLGQHYADCVLALLEQSGFEAHEITAIGCHGQTLYHAPNGATPFTMQIGDANIIAARTGITTVADFRRKDVALGGQGAPLVPAFHAAILADSQVNRVVLNLGGIANISILFPDQPVSGYDTGPANVLLDSWIQKNKDLPYDKEAKWAQQGNANAALLHQLLTADYFQMPAPKSTGRERFNLHWLETQLRDFTLSAVDVQATLAQFTAVSVVNEINQLTPKSGLPCELIVCGGGAHNPLVMQHFIELLPSWSVKTTQDFGIHVDYVEAMAFACLAHQCLNQLPGNVPNVTGAHRAVSLGAIYPAVMPY